MSNDDTENEDLLGLAARAATEYYEESLDVPRFLKDIYITAYTAGYEAARRTQ